MFDFLGSFLDWWLSLPPSYGAALIALSIALVLTVIAFRKSWFTSVSRTYPRATYLVGLFIVTSLVIEAAILALFTDQTTWELGGAQAFIAKDRSKAGDAIPIWRAVWKFDKRYKDYEMVALNRKFSVNASLHPITNNPKVRDLNYSVTIELEGTSEAALLWTKSMESSRADNGRVWLKYHLNEFSETYSRELSVLYNPLDANQQTAFRALLETFMQPRLQNTGARITESRFYLKD